MKWIYVYFHKPTGQLIDEDGDVVIFDNANHPVVFANIIEAAQWLEDNDIRATIAA